MTYIRDSLAYIMLFTSETGMQGAGFSSFPLIFKIGIYYSTSVLHFGPYATFQPSYIRFWPTVCHFFGPVAMLTNDNPWSPPPPAGMDPKVKTNE